MSFSNRCPTHERCTSWNATYGSPQQLTIQRSCSSHDASRDDASPRTAKNDIYDGCTGQRICPTTSYDALHVYTASTTNGSSSIWWDGRPRSPTTWTSPYGVTYGNTSERTSPCSWCSY